MIAILDYGAGNLRSVQKAFEYLNFDARVTNSPEVIKNASHILLPGVGAFGNAMEGLEKSGLAELALDMISQGKPFLGICVGLQLLFEQSEESPGIKGLGVFKGDIVKIPDTGLKIPQMGWNSLEIMQDTPLFKGLNQNEFVYFVHSFYPQAEKQCTVARVIYGVDIDVAVQKDNVFATQFHPEKSGKTGMRILENFARMK